MHEFITTVKLTVTTWTTILHLNKYAGLLINTSHFCLKYTWVVHYMICELSYNPVTA